MGAARIRGFFLRVWTQPPELKGVLVLLMAARRSRRVCVHLKDWKIPCPAWMGGWSRTENIAFQQDFSAGFSISFQQDLPFQPLFRGSPCCSLHALTPLEPRTGSGMSLSPSQPSRCPCPHPSHPLPAPPAPGSEIPAQPSPGCAWKREMEQTPKYILFFCFPPCRI